MRFDFEVRSLYLKKGKFEEIGETPYQKPLSKTPSKIPAPLLQETTGLVESCKVF